MAYFITGTDTDAGKTLLAEALLLKAKQQGLSCYGLKPVAAGAELWQGDLKNSDAIKLQQAASIALPYECINPVLFQQAIAPHIAAEQENKPINLPKLAQQIKRTLQANPADFVVIEGAGGWLVPTDSRYYLSDLVAILGLEVIVVIGLKLGCLNHALLTVRAIEQQGIKVAGWLASQTDNDMQVLEENIATLKEKIKAPCLGWVPYLEKPSAEQAQEFIRLP